jgi:metal-responsive CopG/Arc/MetJ family transcriptional regulator
LKTKQININLSDKLINKIEYLAHGMCMSRSQFLRTLIHESLDKIDANSSLDYRIMKTEQALRELTYQKSLREDNGDA